MKKISAFAAFLFSFGSLVSATAVAEAQNQGQPHTMYGRVRSAYVLAYDRDTDKMIIGIDADDGKFVKLRVVGVDPRFVAGLHVKVAYHIEKIEYSLYEQDVIESLEVLRDPAPTLACPAPIIRINHCRWHHRSRTHRRPAAQ